MQLFKLFLSFQSLGLKESVICRSSIRFALIELWITFYFHARDKMQINLINADFSGQEKSILVN